MPGEILEIYFRYPNHTVSLSFQFLFALFADQILHDPFPLNCLLALSEVPNWDMLFFFHWKNGIWVTGTWNYKQKTMETWELNGTGILAKVD